MRICEKFHTLQGEGGQSGEPSYFIRTSGCVLSCKYCDSKYSWDKNSGIEINDKSTARSFCLNNLEELDRDIRIVFTGGEPLYKDNLCILGYMLDEIRDLGFSKIMFETTFISQVEDMLISNLFGNLLFLRDNIGIDCVIFSISPKLSLDCYGKKINLESEDIIRYYTFGLETILWTNGVEWKNLIFKIVYQEELSEDILKFVERVPSYYFENNFFVMPMTPVPYDSDKYLDNEKKCFNFCLKNNLRYSPRIHVNIWGLERGK